MKYIKTLDIWALGPQDIKRLQPGQWVTAGPQGDKGIYCGVKPSGTIVVAWWHNAKARDYRTYVHTLMEYAK